MDRALLRLGLGTVLAMTAVSAPAQDRPAGPCSPYRAADGDIPSEMPGCARYARPVPGSLADELAFRRARRTEAAGDADAGGLDEDAMSFRRARRANRARSR